MEAVLPDRRVAGDVVQLEAGDRGEIAADVGGPARLALDRLEIEDDRQRFDDRGLALLGEAQLLLDAQALGIGLEVGVEQLLLLLGLALDLLRHLEQVDEHRDLGAQHDRLDRLEHIVDRAHRIAADQMLLSLLTADRKTIGMRLVCSRPRMIWAVS